jgi:hypothetical protein
MKEKFFKALAKARGTDTMPRMCGRIRSSCAKLAPIHDPSQKNTCCDMTSPYGSQEKIRSSTHASKSLPRIHFFLSWQSAQMTTSAAMVLKHKRREILYMQSQWQTIGHAEVDASWGDRKLTYKNISEMRKKIGGTLNIQSCASL